MSVKNKRLFMRKSILFCSFWICFLVGGIHQFLFAGSSIQSQLITQNPDSIQIDYKKVDSDRCWEKAVSFPTTLIYFPVKCISKGMAECIGFIDDKEVIPRAVDWLTSDDGNRAIYPIYGARKGGGIKAVNKGWIFPASKWSISMTAGLRNRQRYLLRISGLPLFRTAVSTDFLMGYRFYPDEPFFGLHSFSELVNRSNYAHEQSMFEAGFRIHFTGRFDAKCVAGFETNHIFQGRDYHYSSTTDQETKETLPGLETGIQFFRYQLELRLDSRNRLSRPTSGGITLFRFGVYQEPRDNKFGFWKATMDFSYNAHLFYNRTLFFRLAGEMTESLSSGEIPFFYLSEIGRQETVRGFHRGRFRDRDMILGSVEYRYPVWTFADCFLFIDVGQVTHDLFKNVSADHLKKGYGGGIRLWGQEGVIISFEIGKSEDGLRFYFGLNQEL